MSSQHTFFLYARKSTDDRSKQLHSLESQITHWRPIITRDKLVVKDILEESKTAKKPGRPVFNRMLERIERGEANGILCWDIDRLFRNPIDEGRVRWLLQHGVIAVIKTPTRSFFPSDSGLQLSIEGGRAADYLTGLIKNVNRGTEDKLKRGEWPFAPTLGYIYDRDKKNIAPHPKNSQIVQTVFDEFARGGRGLSWVAEKLGTLGVVSRNGTLWSKSKTRYFLTNRLYIGVMKWKNKIFEGKYRIFITPELFAKVQTVLKDSSKPRKVRAGHKFPFCGLFRCSCGSMISAQWTRGHGGLYRYYRCSRKRSVQCREPYAQELAVVNRCIQLIKRIGITPERANYLRVLLNSTIHEQAKSADALISDIAEKLSTLQSKLNKLTRAFIDEVVDQDSYEIAKAEIIADKMSLKLKKRHAERTGLGTWNEPTLDVINTLELAAKLSIQSSPKEIADLVRKVGTNLIMTGKQVAFDFAEPYQFTASFLGNLHRQLADNPSLVHDQNWWSSNWCSILYHLRTHFERLAEPPVD